MKRTLPFLLILLSASWMSAQPLPEFPALGGDLASTSGLPDMPAMDKDPISSPEIATLPGLPPQKETAAALPGPSAPAAMPDLLPMQSKPVVTTTSSAPPPSGGLPDLPPEENAPTLSTASTSLPPLPGESAPTAVVGPLPSLPPLPGEQVASVPKNGEKADSTQATTPPQPGEPAPAVTAPVPGESAEGTAPTVAAKAGKKTTAKKIPTYLKAEPAHPNTIFGGLVTPRGRGEEMHLAWSSQEILNAMLMSKYELLKEEGEYNPGGWREFTFRQVKTKRQVKVFVKHAGKSRVWMRVGPGEPPAGVPHKEAVSVRKDSEVAMKILQKKFGKHFSRSGRSWEAPFDRPRS